MIKLTGTIIIPLSAQREALPALDEHIELTRKEAANLVFQVEQDKDNQELFHVYEEFRDKAGFDTHQNLGKARAWGKISQNFKRDFKLEEVK